MIPQRQYRLSRKVVMYFNINASKPIVGLSDCNCNHQLIHGKYPMNHYLFVIEYVLHKCGIAIVCSNKFKLPAVEGFFHPCFDKINILVVFGTRRV